MVQPDPCATPLDEKPQPPTAVGDDISGASSLESQAPDGPIRGRAADVFVFNPFAEGYVAHGSAFTPVKHQVKLAEDLATLPQFLCQPDDVVLLTRRPSADFLNYLKQTGFPLPELVELKAGRIDLAGSLGQRKIGGLRPWAWGPDSVELFKPFLARLGAGTRTAERYFNHDLALLYSKSWSAGFLRNVLARCREGQEPLSKINETQSCVGAAGKPWLCSEQEAGVVVDNLEAAFEAIAAIRRRGHHRVVVKEACGLAGHNAIRLWEPGILPAQQRWLAHALEVGRQVVVEPWLERELDFSVQLEMGPDGLKLRGYTGLLNDRKGQFLANWAEAEHRRCLPSKVAALFGAQAGISEPIHHLYESIFTLLEAELQRVQFEGPINIDALVYRTPQGDCRLKPVVEINPRYTMGRLTVELMRQACPGTCGLFRLVNETQARAEGFSDFPSYAGALGARLPLRLEGEPRPKIRQGTLCLNDPGQAQVCLATFTVSPTPNLPGSVSGQKPQFTL